MKKQRPPCQEGFLEPSQKFLNSGKLSAERARCLSFLLTRAESISDKVLMEENRPAPEDVEWLIPMTALPPGDPCLSQEAALQPKLSFE